MEAGEVKKRYSDMRKMREKGRKAGKQKEKEKREKVVGKWTLRKITLLDEYIFQVYRLKNIDDEMSETNMEMRGAYSNYYDAKRAADILNGDKPVEKSEFKKIKQKKQK